MKWFRGGVPLEVILVRLDAEEDLRAGLARVAEELSLGTAVVLSGQGTLAHARIATASEILLEKPGPLQIVSLQGTLFGGSVDLMLIAARSGEVFAGPAREGCVVNPTAECVLLRVGQLNPTRVPDATGVPRLEAAGRVQPTGEPIMLMGRPVDLAAVALVPRTLIERYEALPLQRTGDTLVVALADPSNVSAIDDLRVATRLRIRPTAVPLSELQAAIRKVLQLMRDT